MGTTWTPVGAVGLGVVLLMAGCRQPPEYRGDDVYGETTVIKEPDGVGDSSAVFRRSEVEPVRVDRASSVPATTTVQRTTTVLEQTGTVAADRQPSVVVERTLPVTGETHEVFVQRGSVPPLKVNVAAPPAALICEDIPLRFMVTNQSGLDVPDARVRATLPPGLTTVEGRTSVDMNIGTVVANETREVIIPVRADRPGRFQSLASVVERPGLAPAEVVESSMVVGRPVLNLAVAATAPSVDSNEVIVTIGVSNTGSVSALDTAVEGAMSPNTNTVDRGGATPRLDRLVWNLGDIAPGERKEIRVRVNAFEPGVVTGRVTAMARCAEVQEGSFRKEVR